MPKQPAPTKFFEDVLGAPLVNNRWAWGAQHPKLGHLVLKVWEDRISKDGEWVIVRHHQDRVRGDKTMRQGQRQRNQHVESMRSGTRAFGVVCRAKDPETTGNRTVDTYISTHLLELGELRASNGADHARIIRRVSVQDFLRPPRNVETLTEDLTEILRPETRISATERQRLAAARLGLGKFRAVVLEA